jgi:hypothetical protein
VHYGLYFLLIGYVVRYVIIPALGEATFGYTDGRFRDFAGILVMAKAMWSGQAGYDLESHLAVNHAWVGPELDKVMPFPYSPTMLYLLGPFCPLPLAWAFAVWSVLNLGVVGWIISQKDCAVVLGPIVFLTPTAIMCFTLGQSALLATAALIYLGRETLRPPIERGARIWLMALVLWALTARPQLAITAGIALLATRYWRPVLIAAGLTLLTTAILTPLLGMRWIGDYISLVTHYDRVTAPPAFAWALVPDYMNNLRALLTKLDVADDWSTKISTGVWLLSLLVVLASAWLRRVPPAVVWATCVLLQLLLCPHVNSYELILLYAVLVFFLYIDLVPVAFRTKAVWLIPILLCLTPVGEPFELLRRSLLVIGLLAVAGMVAWLYIAALRRARRLYNRVV